MYKQIALLVSTVFTLNSALPSLSLANNSVQSSVKSIDTQISQVNALNESFFSAYEAILVDYTYSKNNAQDFQLLNHRISKLYQNKALQPQMHDILMNRSQVKLVQPKNQKTILQAYLDDYKLLRIAQMKILTQKLDSNYDQATSDMKLAFKKMGEFLKKIKESLSIDDFERKSQQEQYQTKLIVSQIALTIAGIITAVAVFTLITPAIIFAVCYGPVIILIDIAAISATWYYSHKVNSPLADVANNLNSAVSEIKSHSFNLPEN